MFLNIIYKHIYVYMFLNITRWVHLLLVVCVSSGLCGTGKPTDLRESFEMNSPSSNNKNNILIHKTNYRSHSYTSTASLAMQTNNIYDMSYNILIHLPNTKFKKQAQFC